MFCSKCFFQFMGFQFHLNSISIHFRFNLGGSISLGVLRITYILIIQKYFEEDFSIFKILCIQRENQKNYTIFRHLLDVTTLEEHLSIVFLVF